MKLSSMVTEQLFTVSKGLSATLLDVLTPVGVPWFFWNQVLINGSVPIGVAGVMSTSFERASYRKEE